MKMKLKYGSTLPLILLASACSTGGAKVVAVEGASRSIASTQVISTVDTTTDKFVGTAESPVADPQSFSVKYSNTDVRGGSTNYQTTVNVPLYISTQQPYTIQVDDYRDRDVYGDYACQVKTPRQGVTWQRAPSNMNEGWKRLMPNNPNGARSPEEKANALNSAINGIGKEYCQRLIQRGFLNSTPQSWEAFTQAINNAARAGILLPQQVTSTLVTSEFENHTGLGFSLTQEGGYDVHPGTCYGYIRTDHVRVGSHPETRYQTVRTQTGTVERSLTINIGAGLLLPSEQEEVDFTVGANPEDLQYTGATHNHYQMTFSNGPESTRYENGLSVIRSASTVNLTAIERIRPTASSNLINDIKIADEGANGMTATLSMSDLAQELINVGTPAGNFIIRYDITACKPFLGVCLNFNEVTAQRSVQATSRVQVLQLEPGILKKKMRYKVKVTLDFTSNAYFSGTTGRENSDGVGRK
jgi:hypothetical protein